VEKGLLEKKIIRKRPGTVGICAAIQSKYGVDAIPHILCGGFDKEDTENFLIDLDFLGIDNVVALRGDAVKTETYFTPSKDGHSYANELVGQITDLNQGKYLDADLLNSHATDFCIGVSGYPEKHMEAPSLESDLHFLKKKMKAGADYVVTQMFFDNQKFFDFVDKARKAGIDAPIIPGLKPLSTLKQLNTIPHRFHVDLPEALVKEVIKCKNNAAVRQVGVEWCIQQSKELKAAQVPFLHYYSMGKAANIKAIAQGVF
jgi:methylenetetrahydrofolate reductase (NADPH)